MSRPDFHYADDGAVTLIFRSPLRFGAKADAETWLRARGFSVGRWQAHSPAGILFARAVDIQKWRNLRSLEREALHGLMTGDGREGPIEVRIFADAPLEAREAVVADPPAPTSPEKVNLVGRAIEASGALVIILCFGAISYVGLYPIIAPHHRIVAKIEMRVPVALEARR